MYAEKGSGHVAYMPLSICSTYEGDFRTWGSSFLLKNIHQETMLLLLNQNGTI